MESSSLTSSCEWCLKTQGQGYLEYCYKRVNNIITVKVDYKNNELQNFVDKLNDVIEEQQCEIEYAIIGHGK